MKSGRLWLALLLVPVLAVMGCEGDAGPQGPQGPQGEQGEQGPQGPAGESALNTCSDCHNDDTELMAVQLQVEDGAHAETVYWARGGSCTQCHSHNGFITATVNGEEIPASFDNQVPVNCRTCHQVHNEYGRDDYALTITTPVDLIMGGTYDNGNGNLCANCHQSRPISPLPVIGGDPVAVGNFRYGPHYATQGNIQSANALFEFTGSATYPASNPHATACSNCHMIDPVANYPTNSYVTGGHTFLMSWDNEGTEEQAIEACQQCHSSAESFDAFGGQTTVQGLLDDLGALLIAEGILNPDGSGYAIPGTWNADVTAAFLNWKFVYHDNSLGVHNPIYTRALLRNTIEAMEARVAK